MLASNKTIKDPDSFTEQETTNRELDRNHLGKTTKPNRGRGSEADLRGEGGWPEMPPVMKRLWSHAVTGGRKGRVGLAARVLKAHRQL